jgi:phage terminase small subunit
MADVSLSDKQEAFTEEYLVDFNQTAAAKRAGYSEHSAMSQASQLMSNTKVMAGLAEKRALLAEAHGVTSKRVIEELAKIAFSDVRNVLDEEGGLLPPSEWSDDAAATVGSVELSTAGEFTTIQKIKQYDKLAALDKLARNLGLFENEVGEKVKIEFNFGRMERGVL